MQQELFITHIPWNENVFSIPATASAYALACGLFDSDQSVSIILLSQIAWISYLHYTLLQVQQYYEKEMKGVVARIMNLNQHHNLSPFLRLYNQQKRYTHAYVQLAVFAAGLQAFSALAASYEMLPLVNPLSVFTMALFALFIYLSNRHFRLRYRPDPTQTMPPQCYVLMGGLQVLAWVMGSYVRSK